MSVAKMCARYLGGDEALVEKIFAARMLEFRRSCGPPTRAYVPRETRVVHFCKF